MKQSLSNLKIKINLKSLKAKATTPVHQAMNSPTDSMTSTTTSDVKSRPALPVIGESSSYERRDSNSRMVSSVLSAATPSTPSCSSRRPSFSGRSVCARSDSTPQPYNIEDVLQQHGYVCCKQITKTLQGAIYKATRSHGGKPVVIKVTNKALHERSVAMVDGQEIAIQENIVDEIRILRWLTMHEAPATMTRFIDYFQDNDNIFLVQEDGGMDLFKFVAECHKLIEAGHLPIYEWQAALRVLFKQMVDYLDWLHNVMAVCHMDISLENFLISDVMVMSERGSDGKQQLYLSHNFQLKFCDFGLATVFDGKNFRCDKYVGKTGYKAPKVYGKRKVFDARAADTWSLGISLFMMMIGAPPFKRASRKEVAYELIMQGRMDELLNEWNRLHYATPDMLDVLQKMLQPEHKRITIKEIRKHPWLQ